eukprot:Gb_26861 [translate_table: standard]
MVIRRQSAGFISSCNIRGHIRKPTNKPKEGTSFNHGSPGINQHLWALCDGRRLEEALGVLQLMDRRVDIRAVATYACLLQVCNNLKSLEDGNRLHAHIIKSGFEPGACGMSKLLNIYAKCGSLEYARQLFDQMSERNEVSWNMMIARYVQDGRGEESLVLFRQMQRAYGKPDEFTFASVLRVCSTLAVFEQGKQVHACIIRRGYASNLVLGSALVDVYAKCRRLADARQVFDEMSETNVVSWTAMIAGYTQCKHGKEALMLFNRMQQARVNPNDFTFATILKACVSLSAQEFSEQVHACIIRSGFESNAVVASALIDMYAKCGKIHDARLVFDRNLQRNTVLWTTMIAGYSQHGYGEEALITFSQMQQTGIKPDEFTFSSILRACAGLAALDQGKRFHAHIIRSGLQSQIILASALVDLYAKCGSIERARQVFDNISERNVVSWTAMIGGYVQHGYGWEALVLFRQMQRTGMNSDQFTFASILTACANLATAEQGKQVHALIIKSELNLHFVLASALVDMYAKCGIIEEARHVFDKMSERDVVLWTVMIAGYGKYGHVKEVFQLLKQMQEADMKPNHITFLAILSACSHAGLVEEAWHYFGSMTHDYCFTPRVEHYTCMVDLLGRAGHLVEAYDFINKMPIEPDPAIWGALLSACRIHANIELGILAAEKLFELDPDSSGNYVVLSNMYAASSRWEDVSKVRQMMKDRGLKKEPGCSWIEVQKRVHVFLVGDKSHPQSEEIYATLERLNGQIQEVGYVPSTNILLHDME